jgi:hypothetical protein
MERTRPAYAASIVIPVFNQWALTRDCLRSLAECTPEPIQTIVVDNGSTDETTQELDNLGGTLWGRSFTSIHSPENLGFARGCNLGAKKAESRTLIFLNNDTLLSPNWLTPLVRALENEKQLGAVGPLLLYPHSDRVQHAGITFLPGNQAEHLYEYFPASHPVVGKSRSLQALTAAALCISRKNFWLVNGFFEGFMNGCEDMDLCLNLGKQGFTMACVPESRVLHFTSRTPGRFDRDMENSALLISRHGPDLLPDIHIHAQKDGYDVQLNEWLLLSLCLPPEKTRELDEKAVGRTCAEWLDMVEREPLWKLGYDLVGDWLEGREAHTDAAHIRTLAAHFHPSRKTYVKLLHSTHKAGLAELTAHTAQKLENIDVRIRHAREQAKKMRAWACESEQHFWERLYAGWLDESTNPTDGTRQS